MAPKRFLKVQVSFMGMNDVITFWPRSWRSQIRLDFSVGLIAGNQYRAEKFKTEESGSSFYGQIVAKLFGEKHDHNNELIAEHNITNFCFIVIFNKSIRLSSSLFASFPHIS